MVFALHVSFGTDTVYYFAIEKLMDRRCHEMLEASMLSEICIRLIKDWNNFQFRSLNQRCYNYHFFLFLDMTP